MKKLLKIGVPILVAVLLLIIGTGIALAQNTTPALTGTSASYDDGYSQCPQQCQGPQGCICPQPDNCAGNCNGNCGSCGNGAYCSKASYCKSNYGNTGADYQPRCGGCRR